MNWQYIKYTETWKFSVCFLLVQFQDPVWNKLNFKIFKLSFYAEKWLVKLEVKTVIHTQVK